MGGDIRAFLQAAIRDANQSDFTVENVDIVEGDILATINGVDYAFTVEVI